MSHSILKNVAQTIRSYGMFHSKDSVLVGVSGGPDSVALLHILLGFAPEYSLNIGVAHLNHSLRGESSDQDAEFVEHLARSLNLPYYIRKADVRNYQHIHRLSLEEAARNVRYAFFQETAEKNGFDTLALGHHADDNAELTLMYLLRGSGTTGISGIPPIRDFHSLKIVRPLIHLTRAEIDDFLTAKGLSSVCDESNTETKYLRNQIRHDLLPELKASYNPRVTEALNRFSSIIRSEAEWLDQEIITPLFRDAVVSADNETILLSIQKITLLHMAAKRRVIRKAIEFVKGDLRRIAYAHTEAVISLMQSKTRKGTLDLPDGIRIESDHDTLVIKRSAKLSVWHPTANSQQQPFEYNISELGTFFIREAGICMKFEKYGSRDKACSERRDGSATRLCELFDMETLKFPLTVRNIRPGDRFTPLGMTGTQKLKKYFINNKIPAAERARCAVLLSREKIIWLIGHRIDDSVRITPSTRNILKAGWSFHAHLLN